MAYQLPSHLSLGLENTEPPLQIHSEEDRPSYLDGWVFSRNFQAIFLDHHILNKLQELLGNPEGNNIQMQRLQHDRLIRKIPLDDAFPISENRIRQRNAQILLV